MPNFLPRPHTTVRPEWISDRVSSLISPISHQWDQALLYERFDDVTISHILQLPAPVLGHFDRWVWTLDASGQYSTKSIYHSLLPPFEVAASPLSIQQWKKLWKLPLHAHLPLLLWKLAWNLLPTRARIDLIIHREALPTSLCSFCHAQVEHMNHLFLECIISRIIWREAPWPIMIDRFANLPITSWLSVILDPSVIAIPLTDHHYFQLYAVTAIDLVWFETNQIVHGCPPLSFSQLIARIHQTTLVTWRLGGSIIQFFRLCGNLLPWVLSKSMWK